MRFHWRNQPIDDRFRTITIYIRTTRVIVMPEIGTACGF